MEIMYILDDSKEFTDEVKVLLEHKGITNYKIFNDVDEFKENITEDMIVAVVDFFMPKMNGMEVMREVKAVQPDCLVIIVSVNEEAHLPITVHNYNYVKIVCKSDDNFINEIIQLSQSHFDLIRLEKEFKQRILS